MKQASVTFRTRKAWEHKAFACAAHAFAALGFQLEPVAVDRDRRFTDLTALIARTANPTRLLFLQCFPDAVAVRGDAVYYCELKSVPHRRRRFALRLRDLWASWAWDVLLVVVALEPRAVHAQFARRLPRPEAVYFPRPPHGYEHSLLAWLHQRFPQVPECPCDITHGSGAPFAVWRLAALPRLEDLLGGDR